MLQVLDFNCIFCGRGTNFKDNDKAYCIDCYCKLRETAHTHEGETGLPKPLKISPQPTTVPFQDTVTAPYIGDNPRMGVVIC